MGPPSHGKRRQKEAARLPPKPQPPPSHISPSSGAWGNGQPTPLSSSVLSVSHPHSLGNKSPEGHDHHQGNDSSLQEALADAGLVWHH